MSVFQQSVLEAEAGREKKRKINNKFVGDFLGDWDDGIGDPVLCWEPGTGFHAKGKGFALGEHSGGGRQTQGGFSRYLEHSPGSALRALQSRYLHICWLWNVVVRIQLSGGLAREGSVAFRLRVCPSASRGCCCRCRVRVPVSAKLQNGTGDRNRNRY